jgi:hypothetical protein
MSVDDMTAPIHRHALAAALEELDFGLDPRRRQELADHLRTCDACRVRARAYRHDAESLRRVAFVHAPDSVRTKVLGAAARPARREPTWLLLVAALLILALAATVALTVGALLQQDPLERPFTWTAIRSEDLAGATEDLAISGVAAGNGLFVAVGRDAGGGVALVSSDGASWTVAPLLGDATLRDVAFLPGRGEFVAAGALGSRPTIWRSVDGVAWAPAIMSDALGLALAVSERGSTVIAVGAIRPAGGSGTAADPIRMAIWTSSTLDAWAQATITGGEPPTGELVAVGAVGSLAIAIGGSVVLHSTAGAAWTAHSPGGFEATITSLAGGNDVLLGNMNAPGFARVGVTVDGRQWTGVPLPSGGGGVVASVHFDEGVFVAVGNGTGSALAWTSPDGRVWSPPTALPALAGATVGDAASTGGRTVVFGRVGGSTVLWLGREGDR